MIFLRHNYPSGDDDMGYNIFVVEFALHTRTTDRFFLFVFNFLSHNYPWGAHDTEYLVHFFLIRGDEIVGTHTPIVGVPTYHSMPKNKKNKYCFSQGCENRLCSPIFETSVFGADDTSDIN